MITITIQFESTDLTDLLDNTNWGRLLATLPTAPTMLAPRPIIATKPADDSPEAHPAATPKAQTTPAAGEEKKERNTRPRPALAFEEFDKLARKELKRLSIDKRIPGHKLWEDQRDERLPTLGGVLQRYNVATLAELAALVGLEPPLRGNHAPLGVQETQESQ